MLQIRCDLRFPTMWYMRPAKPQISLRIRAVWSEPLLVAWFILECLATDWTSFGVSKLKRRLQRLVWVYTCQNTTLLETTCRGSNAMRHCIVTVVTAEASGLAVNRENWRYIIKMILHECSCFIIPTLFLK